MSEMNSQFVAWHSAEGVGWLTLNRPPLNILNIAMLAELGAALEAASQDESLRALVIRANGTLRVFSAGVDVADHTVEKVGEMIPLFDRVCAAIAEFPSPTLAAVHGHALGGGCELALCCDLVVAAEGAKFGQPEIKLATLAPIAALRLPALVGYRRAAELLFTGEAVGAVEAARIGLINRAVPADELDQAVDQLVGNLRGLSSVALRLCKRAARLGANGWANLSAMERLYLDDLMSTADAREGVASFLEKRAPVWRHK
ncbi:MAG: enoyl-CoA hydratase/isomerase family protein [Chloroflexi bacterium]|nr:enoyl-CoA hydratase/isomerase family protein [Chloroflexota bacterium]